MPKKFNTTGVCIPEKHYMVDISGKLSEIMKLIDDAAYFTLHLPRQYGKTTTLDRLAEQLNQGDTYLALSLSLEGLEAEVYESTEQFCARLAKLIQRELKSLPDSGISVSPQLPKDFFDLAGWFTELNQSSTRNIVLMLDEVDQSSGHDLFLQFLGMLRDKYLRRERKKEESFHSVILAGVRDVKSLKLKVRHGEAVQYNSPWNIAADFNVSMDFSSHEIESMLRDYGRDREINLDVPRLALEIYWYTSGYPFLVSRVCKFLDETLQDWSLQSVSHAISQLAKESNTNFENVIKTLENDPQLSDLVFEVLFLNTKPSFTINEPLINLGVVYGIFKNVGGILKCHNKLYEELLYDYFSLKMERKINPKYRGEQGRFVLSDGSLDMEQVLVKFQTFMKEEYSRKDEDFLERNGQLIFLAFLRPILNGRGFSFKEVQISEEKRLDLVITFQKQIVIVELKLWRGEKAHQQSLRQLTDYLQRQNQKEGYLVIFDITKRQKMNYQSNHLQIDGQTLFIVWV